MKENIAKKYTELQNDFEKKISTGKLNGMSLSDLMAVGNAGKELLKHHAVKTVIKNVADYFKKFGFMVTMDFDNVNYVIAEV